jgi:hypothetical protein
MLQKKPYTVTFIKEEFTANAGLHYSQITKALIFKTFTVYILRTQAEIQT